MGLLITSSSAEIWICFVDWSGKPISAGRNGGAMPPMDGQLAPILTQLSLYGLECRSSFTRPHLQSTNQIDWFPHVIIPTNGSAAPAGSWYKAVSSWTQISCSWESIESAPCGTFKSQIIKISLEGWFACKSHPSPTPIPRQTPQAWGRSGQQSGRRQTARWRRWRGRCWWTSPSTRSSPGWGRWCPRRPPPTWTPSWPRSTISSTCRASWSRLPCQDSSNISKTLRQPCLIVYLPLCLYCDKYILQNYVYIYLSFLNSVFFWSVLTETKNNFTCRRRCKHYWLKILRKQGSM